MTELNEMKRLLNRIRGAGDFEPKIQELINQCDSFIEKWLFINLYFGCTNYFGEFIVGPSGKHRDLIAWKPATVGISIIPQARVFSFDLSRADFLIVVTRSDLSAARLIVECDGYEFHKSRSQQETDHKRDRELTAKGISFFRFGGSEIDRDAAKCADEILKFLSHLGSRNG